MTMDAQQAAARITACGVITIVRGEFSADYVQEAANVLLDAGIDVLEVTLNSPDALVHIAALRAQLGERALVGAGTVRSVVDIDQARDAGAQFLVSPHADHVLIEHACAASLLYLPGVFTPTEAAAAVSAGATMLKLFPASVVGPAYLQALRAPLDDVALVPVGGVDADNAAAFMRAGAVALGVGSWLVKPGRDLETLAARATRLKTALMEGRGHA